MSQMSGMQPPFVLAVDVGTSSTRAILFDAAATPLANCRAQTTNHIQTTHDGGAFFNIDEIERSVIEAIDRLLEKADHCSAQIGCVAMATLAANFLGVDGSGTPVTPVYTYADTRSRTTADQLRAQWGKEGRAQYHDRTGCFVHTSYLPVQLIWLSQAYPVQFSKAERWMSLSEYLLWRFFGQRRVSYSMASWTGLLNRRRLCWDEKLLSSLPIEKEQLSGLTDVHEPFCGLIQGWAERWPALASVPWIPAIGDGAAANIGSGCGSPATLSSTSGSPATLSSTSGSPATLNAATSIALTIGTTGAMRVTVDAQKIADQKIPEGLWLYRIDHKRGLLGGATTEGGNVYAWLRRTLLFSDELAAEKTLQMRRPTEHGLTILPFVAGERAPGWQDDARASILNFTLNTQPIDILQAALEGMAYRFSLIYRQILEAISNERISRPPINIVASGGAILSSPAWLQIMADTLNQPVTALDVEEVTARGLAILGLLQLGVIQTPEERPPPMGTRYEPSAENHCLHLEAIERQIRYYERLI